MTKTQRFRWLAALLAGVAVSGPAATVARAQEPPPEPDSTEEPPPEGSVPDDTGIVHSWALAPGDGSAEAGERPNLSYQLPPGGEVHDIVTLYNFSNVELTFRVYATDAYNNEDGSFDLLPDRKSVV